MIKRWLDFFWLIFLIFAVPSSVSVSHKLLTFLSKSFFFSPCVWIRPPRWLYHRWIGGCVSAPFNAERWSISAVPFSAAPSSRWTVATGESYRGAPALPFCPFQMSISSIAAGEWRRMHFLLWSAVSQEWRSSRLFFNPHASVIFSPPPLPLSLHSFAHHLPEPHPSLSYFLLPRRHVMQMCWYVVIISPDTYATWYVRLIWTLNRVTFLDFHWNVLFLTVSLEVHLE